MPEVTHVAPLTFGEDGMWGGGERYVLELGRAMARHVPTRLVSFGPRRRTFHAGDLEVRILPVRTRWRGGDINPLSEWLPYELGRSRVLHAHHYRSVVTNLCLLTGGALRRPVYCTDHGGSARHYAAELGLERYLSGFLAVSRFSAGLFPAFADRSSIVYGGVDPDVFTPGPAQREPRVLYVGRLLWFKGVDVLIRAIDAATTLELYGPSYDGQYRAELERLAAGKQVTFRDPPPQAALVEAYHRSRVAVLPSVLDSPYGQAPGELFPLVVLEAMACGTPVVASDVGGVGEAVVDGETGFLVPPGDDAALADRIATLLHDDALWRRMSEASVERVRAEFTWDRVAERCLAQYARGRG